MNFNFSFHSIPQILRDVKKKTDGKTVGKTVGRCAFCESAASLNQPREGIPGLPAEENEVQPELHAKGCSLRDCPPTSLAEGNKGFAFGNELCPCAGRAVGGTQLKPQGPSHGSLGYMA